MRTLAALASAATGLIAFGGCGSSSHHSTVKAAARSKPRPPSVCRPAGAASVAGTLGVSTSIVRSTATTGNNSFPECHFAATSAGRRITVIVNVDNSPQPYFRLERTIVEDGQQFGVQRNFSPPQTVSHLGLDAAWVPDQRLLLTTDGKELISVTIGWRGAGPGKRVALAKAAAQAYLGKPQSKNATGFSSA